MVALGGAAPAYAGWSAAPTAASSSPSSQADQSCLGALSSDQPAGDELGSGPWQPLLTDVRGPFTVALYQNDSAYMGCFTSSSFTQVTQVSSGGDASNGVLKVSGSGSGSGSPSQSLSTVTVAGTTSGDLQNVVQSHLSTADGPYTLVNGRVASGVTGVTLVLDNGQDVVATVADGWLLAWWPSDITANSSQVTNGSGTDVRNSRLVGQGTSNPPAPGSCTPTSTPVGTNGIVHCASSGGGREGSGNSGQQRQRPERHPSWEQWEHWRDRNRPDEVLSRQPTNPAGTRDHHQTGICGSTAQLQHAERIGVDRRIRCGVLDHSR